MISYIFIVVLFSSFALIEAILKRSIFAVPLAIIFVCFAGLRFETGNDWYTYKQFFEISPTLGKLFALGGGWPDSSYELLYVLLTSIVKTLGGNFYVLQFLVVAFNAFALNSFVRRFACSPAFVYVPYFAILYLPAQMAAIRHSIAASLVLLALLEVSRDKRIRGFVLVLLGGGFQISALFFLPALALGRVTRLRIVAVFGATALVVGLCAYAIRSGTYYWYEPLIGPFAVQVFSYLTLTRDWSVLAMAYALINLFALIYLYLRRRDLGAYWSNELFWCVVILVAAQLVLWFAPAFWNRIQTVALVAELCVLSAAIRRFPTYARIAVVSTVCVGAIGVLVIGLQDPAMVSYVPFQWLPLEYVDSYGSDGERRFFEALEIHAEQYRTVR